MVETIHSLILQNTFIKAFVLPVILTITSGVVEFIIGLNKGYKRDDYKYLVWLKEKDSNGNTVVRSRRNQAISDVKKLLNTKDVEVLEVELMPELGWSLFGLIGIDLAIGAIAVSVAATKADLSSITTLFGVHFLLFVFVLACITRVKLAEPKENTTKWSISAFLAGFFAMLVAFLFIGGGGPSE